MIYYVNKNAQTSGEHEVHCSTCEHLPNVENRLFLGSFATSKEAVKEAEKFYTIVDGCAFCCPGSHKR